MTRILFAEDDIYLREIYHLRLAKSFDAEVISASSGNRAIEILKSDQKFDVIVSDFSMPNGNGLDLLGFKLRNDITIPLIFFTNTIEPEIPFERNTYIDVILKDSFDKLCQSIQTVIGKSL